MTKILTDKGSVLLLFLKSESKLDRKFMGTLFIPKYLIIELQIIMFDVI